MRPGTASLALLAAAALLAGCGSSSSKTASTGSTGTATSTTPQQGEARVPGDPHLRVGIGDQNAAMFANPLFGALHVRIARLVVSYDTVDVGFEKQLVDQWMAAAKQAGVDPFVTFGHSRVHPTKLPSVAEFTRDFTAFRERYPQVKTYAAWNEINHASQPTADHPERAAAYFNVVRAHCQGCTVVAGDLLDQAGAERYLRRYVKALHGATPIWGLHNYSDTNRFRDRGTRDFLAATRGEVWLTETGGVAKFGRAFPFSLSRQARAIRYMVRLARSSDRITRLYVYNWTGAPAGARFDSGLTNADGSARPAYDALKSQLGG